MALLGQAAGVPQAAALVLVVQDEVLRGEQVSRLGCSEGAAGQAGCGSLTWLCSWRSTLGSSPASRPSSGCVMRKSTSWPCGFPLQGQASLVGQHKQGRDFCPSCIPSQGRVSIR